MATRTPGERAIRDRIQRIADAGLTPERLALRLMEVVLAVVPGDGYRLFGLDPATRLVNRLLAASGDDGWARLEWLRECYLRPTPVSYIEHHHLTELNLPAVAFQPDQRACWGYPDRVLSRITDREHRRWYDELACPTGGTLLVQFPAHGRWIAALQLYRRDERWPFSAEDVHLMRRLTPLIGEVLAAALARERALATRPAHVDVAGVILLSGTGQVTMATQSAETWLARVSDAGPVGSTPLPSVIWSAVAGLRSGASLASAIMAPTVQGPLRVEASRAGEDGSVAVVLTPERPVIEPTLPETWRLTPREQRVVELLLRGHSNRGISHALHISENTVEYHLRHAYEKLDVHSRGHLLSRFFRDTFWPSLNESFADSAED